jgi:hypothetical protein
MCVVDCSKKSILANADECFQLMNLLDPVLRTSSSSAVLAELPRPPMMMKLVVRDRDLQELKDAGVTHLRIPMSYWIRGDLNKNNDKEGSEQYIRGGWLYFVRPAKWCRQIGGLTIWADLHGAPGSENGFDNSGIFKGVRAKDGIQILTMSNEPSTF